ncbi:MAG: hypothetical protein EOP06_30190 [Proteobacteria bacterium]|nr:MAG: hypothetical protein EOP06_30190 [Pseudomonadota bacterium]
MSLHSGTLALFTRNRDELLKRTDAVLKGLNEGWLDFTPAHVFPIQEAAKAHELMESRGSIGKIILKFD